MYFLIQYGSLFLYLNCHIIVCPSWSCMVYYQGGLEYGDYDDYEEELFEDEDAQRPSMYCSVLCRHFTEIYFYFIWL